MSLWAYDDDDDDDNDNDDNGDNDEVILSYVCKLGAVTNVQGCLCDIVVMVYFNISNKASTAH